MESCEVVRDSRANIQQIPYQDFGPFDHADNSLKMRNSQCGKCIVLAKFEMQPDQK